MRTQKIYTDYQDHFEYFGNSEIERIRMEGEKVIIHDWINFDTVDEALGFFQRSLRRVRGLLCLILDFFNNFHPAVILPAIMMNKI